jgi:hypothetical protein
MAQARGNEHGTSRGVTNTEESQRWFFLPLCQNPMAAVPVTLAAFGAPCLETAALFHPFCSALLALWMAKPCHQLRQSL